MVIWDILKENLGFVTFWTAKVNGPLDGLYLFVPIYLFFYFFKEYNLDNIFTINLKWQVDIGGQKKIWWYV